MMSNAHTANTDQKLSLTRFLQNSSHEYEPELIHVLQRQYGQESNNTVEWEQKIALFLGKRIEG